VRKKREMRGKINKLSDAEQASVISEINAGATIRGTARKWKISTTAIVNICAGVYQSKAKQIKNRDAAHLDDIREFMAYNQHFDTLAVARRIGRSFQKTYKLLAILIDSGEIIFTESDSGSRLFSVNQGGIAQRRSAWNPSEKDPLPIRREFRSAQPSDFIGHVCANPLAWGMVHCLRVAA
jgi:hypothetical protein